MLANDYPDTFIVLNLHYVDSYATDWTAERATFYGVGGIPHVRFDGLAQLVGTQSTDQATYDWYLPEIQNRWTKPTDVTINLSLAEVAAQTYRVTATVGIDAAGVGKDIIVHFVRALDNYPAAIDDRYHNCVRQHDETTISLLAGESTSVDSIDFFLTGDDWTNQDDVKFIVWAQSTNATGPSEVYQAAQTDLSNVGVEGDVNGDGAVNLADLALLLGSYGLCDGQPGYNAAADIDGSGCVQLNDLATLLANYGVG